MNRSIKQQDTIGAALLDDRKALIFNIQRFSLQDGPGIRTTVFFKGCPLKCWWCSNPESQHPKPELMHRNKNCQACGACVEICPSGAVSMENGAWRLNRDLCDLCFECVHACPGGAIDISGSMMSLDDVIEEAAKDEPFYKNSGGGVTLSGGEPLFQAEFAVNLLKGCRERGLHTCLDTCGYAPWETLNRALDHTDLILFDLKHIDLESHIEGTLASNELILENLEKLAEAGKSRIWIRIPVIPDFNASVMLFQKIAERLNGQPIEKVSLLGYHEWGKSKYEALGRDYLPNKTRPSRDLNLEPFKDVLEAAGLDVTIDH